jgi:hypothetical protein
MLSNNIDLMSLDEAIEHCVDKSTANEGECSLEHQQLAEWLKELKIYREKDSKKLFSENNVGVNNG